MPPANWYPDPSDPGALRYWDGSAWTGHTRPRPLEQPAGDGNGDLAQSDGAKPLGPGDRPYASFGRRLVGLIVDNLILGIPLAIVLSARLGPIINRFSEQLQALGPDASPEQMNKVVEEFMTSLSAGTLFGVALVTAGINLLYFGVCLHQWGRTIGGQLMGIRCVDAEGQWPTWRQSFIRAAIPAGLNLLGAVPGIGIFGTVLLVVNYLSMLSNPRRQAWMDRAASTFVVRA
jgi:uncharacterized RDD family membrane protein YckC